MSIYSALIGYFTTIIINCQMLKNNLLAYYILINYLHQFNYYNSHTIYVLIADEIIQTFVLKIRFDQY